MPKNATILCAQRSFGPVSRHPDAGRRSFCTLPDVLDVPLHTPAGTFHADFDLLPTGHLRIRQLSRVGGTP
jgi:hypothetical protein